MMIFGVICFLYNMLFNDLPLVQDFYVFFLRNFYTFLMTYPFFLRDLCTFLMTYPLSLFFLLPLPSDPLLFFLCHFISLWNLIVQWSVSGTDLTARPCGLVYISTRWAHPARLIDRRRKMTSRMKICLIQKSFNL